MILRRWPSRLRSAAAALGLAVAAAAAFAQAPATPVTPQDEAAKAGITLDAAKQRLVRAQQEYDLLQQRYRAGAVNATDVNSARAQLDQAQSDLRLAEVAELPARRRDVFFRPVDVTLHDATLPQAADVLTKFAGFPVAIGQDVPRDIRVSLQARGVPFGTVLEAVAREAKLMIAPERTGGVLLRPWPIMVVNGDKTQRYVGPNAPWSDEWGAPPGLPFPGMDQMPRWQLLPGIVGQPGSGSAGGGVGAARPGEGSPSAAAGEDYSAQNPPVGPSPYQFGQYVPFGGGAPGPRPGGLPVALSQLAENMVVLAEPGVGGQGEPGVWLTVYLYDAREGRLVRRGSTFHVFQSPGPHPGAGQPDRYPTGNPFGRPNDVAPGSIRRTAPPQTTPGAQPGVRPTDPTRPDQPAAAGTEDARPAPIGAGSVPEQPKPSPAEKPAPTSVGR